MKKQKMTLWDRIGEPGAATLKDYVKFTILYGIPITAVGFGAIWTLSMIVYLFR